MMKNIFVKIKLAMNITAAILCIAALKAENKKFGIIAVILYFTAIIMCRPMTVLLSSLKSVSPSLSPDVQIKNKQRIILFLGIKILLLVSVIFVSVNGMILYTGKPLAVFLIVRSKDIHKYAVILMTAMIFIQLLVNILIHAKGKKL